MSRFDNIWKNYVASSDIHGLYKEKCFKFIKNFIVKVVSDLGWQSENISFVITTTPSKSINYQQGLSDLSQVLLPVSVETKFWYLNLSFRLWEQDTKVTENLYPVNFVFPISFEGNKNKFVVKVANKTYELYENDTFEEVSANIAQKINSIVDTSLHWRLENIQGDKVIFIK